MEEDIKILEQFLVGNKYCEGCEEKCVDCYIEYKEVQAVANLLTRYKQLEQENKKLQESHDYIFDAYQDAGNKMFDYQEENENLKQSLIINKNLYEEVCNKNKELEEENKKLNNANKTYINAIQNITPVLMNDYVDKSLIKEKIEELKVERDKVYKQFLDSNKTDGKLHTKGLMLEGTIQFLQELVKEK